MVYALERTSPASVSRGERFVQNEGRGEHGDDGHGIDVHAGLEGTQLFYCKVPGGEAERRSPQPEIQQIE